MFSRKKNNNEENLSLIGGKNNNNNNYNNDDYAASSPPFNSPALAPSQQQQQQQKQLSTAATTILANANAAVDDELVGIVYCCAQPTNFAHAPTFEWSSLDMNSSRVSCRKVVQRIFARIDTTSFGERRQYVNDLGNVQLLSIIGVDKCIFVVGCMKKDFLVDSDGGCGGGDGGDGGAVGGGSVMVEMDRLLVSMQRAFAQHVARQVGIGRRMNNNNNNNANNQKKKRGEDDDDQHENCKIDDESLSNFDTAIQNAIDDASNRISDIIYHSAAAVATQHNSSITGNGLHQPGPGLFRRFLPSSGSNGANNNNNTQQNQNNANRYGYQHHESVAATYLSGGTGADDFGFESGAGGVGTRQSFLFNLRKSQQRNRNNGEGGEDDDFDEEAGDNWCCPSCCTTRVKFISCFVVVFIAAVVIFILLFVCERKGTNGFQLSCGN